MLTISTNGRRKLLLIIACLVFSVSLILLLYAISDKANHRPNGFIRLFPPALVTWQKALDLRYNSYDIAGATQQRIYLGNSTAPSYMLASNYALSDTQQLRLGIPDTAKLQKGVKVAIDSPYTYIMRGVNPVIGSGTLSAIRLRPLPDSLAFFSAVPISPASFILRTYDRRLERTILTKLALNSPNVEHQVNALEEQVDGIFCTDGTLFHDPVAARLVYVYYYRNQFICLDTNLNVLYKARTIDTVSHARIKLTKATTKGETTMSAPPLFVNKQSCISGDYIFVHSALLANNEQKKIFDRCSVIDVYALKDGHYVFSFYLPDHNNKKVSHFRIFNKTLVAIHDHYLLTYQLNF